MSVQLIQHPVNDFDDLLPLIGNGATTGEDTTAIFQYCSKGLKTPRNEWVYDFSRDALAEKMRFFVDVYEATRTDPNYGGKMQIKWDGELEKYREHDLKKTFEENQILLGQYRPFVKIYLYFDKHFNGVTDQTLAILPRGEALKHFRDPTEVGITAISFSAPDSEEPFVALLSYFIPDLHLVGKGSRILFVPIAFYNERGDHVDNITDWALQQFQQQYAKFPHPQKNSQDAKGKTIRKIDIFYYVYAVLHHPTYREKYKLNLKRDFPRIPFYDDFWQWANWGEHLVYLHRYYDAVPPYMLERHEIDPQLIRAAYKARLEADKKNGVIELDTTTSLSGIPTEAWEHKLGNRSALEWVLDRYKERKPKDPTIREQFNTYRFADYKEQVIDLLSRVCTVSVETMRIIHQMPEGK